MNDPRSRWEEVQRLFHRAVEVQPAERERLLEMLCDDESIRAEVQSLLHHDAAGETLLDRDLADAA